MTISGGRIKLTQPTSSINAPNLAMIDNSGFVVTSGGSLTLPAPTTYSVEILRTETFSASQGQLAFPALTTLDYNIPFIGPNANVPSAAGATIDLSAVQSIIVCDNLSTLTFNASGNSQIDLSSLTTFDTQKVVFNADGTSEILRP